MALINGKQIKSVSAVKIVETSEKKFVTEAQITDFTGKATAEQVATAKTEAIEAASAHTDGEVAKVDAKVGAVETKVTTVEGSLATGLEDRYTKAEVEAKLAQLGAGIKYKGTVASYDEIATKFPNPEEGWLVAVEGTKKFYVYDADTSKWEVFPIDMSVNTTYVKTIRVVVADNQTVINTGIKTNGTGSHQTSTTLAGEIGLSVNGFDQAKTVDYTVATVADEVVVTWIATEFVLEASDVITVTYNQTV